MKLEIELPDPPVGTQWVEDGMREDETEICLWFLLVPTESKETRDAVEDMKKMPCPFPPEPPCTLAGMTREWAEQIALGYHATTLKGITGPDPSYEPTVQPETVDAILAAVAEAVEPYQAALMGAVFMMRRMVFDPQNSDPDLDEGRYLLLMEMINALIPEGAMAVPRRRDNEG